MPDRLLESSNAAAERLDGDTREIVVSLLQGDLSSAKRIAPTGCVRVSTITREREELVDQVRACEQVEIERVAIDKPVDTMPPVREEGDTIIVPIVEEVLKVERLLHLKEEVRIRRKHATERRQERVTLRRQEAVVTRVPVEAEAAAAGPSEGSGKKENP